MKLFRTINAVKTDKAYLLFIVIILYFSQTNIWDMSYLIVPKNLPRTLSQHIPLIVEMKKEMKR